MDRDNTLWVGNARAGGLSRYEPSTDTFTNYWHDPDIPDSIMFSSLETVLEYDDMLLLGTANGLDTFNKTTGKATHLFHAFGAKDSLEGRSVRMLFQDTAGTLWVGTRTSGVYRYRRHGRTFERMALDEKIALLDVSSMLEDRQRHLWFGTANGLVRLNTVSGDVFNYYESDGLAGNNHYRNAAWIDQQGILYFGSIGGVTRIDPTKLKKPSDSAKVVINGFRINNQEVAINDGKSPLKVSIAKTEQLALNHHHSMVTFEFTLLSFNSSDKNEFAYTLEGFDEGWNEVGTQNNATYTNIDPGDYVFKVRAKNSRGVWGQGHTSLAVRVSPPPWATGWAYAFYTLLVLLLVGWWVKYEKKKLELEQEKSINTELLRLDKVKDSFLSCTSHELRTPLMGIVGIAEMMMEERHQRDEGLQDNLALIASSGRRLSNLINDILDYAKMVDGSLEIMQAPTNLGELIDLVFYLLGPLAEPKNIKCIKTLDEHCHYAYADEARVQQILLNLIGNAIKYSDGGQIKVVVEPADDAFIQITVEDTGIGIAPSEHSSIFESFRQVTHLTQDSVTGDNVTRDNGGGTGLGLSITKQLIELHQGAIWLESALGEGSKFIFTLPLLANDSAAHTHSYPTAHHEDSHIQSGAPSDNNGQPARATILIVDDHPVNRVFVGRTLNDEGYNVIECDNGLCAIEKVKSAKQKIDLIISDVSMPKMGGYQMCAELRPDYDFLDLPIIFLSANKTDETLHQCMDVGGNDYLEKPVSKTELLMKVSFYLKLSAYVKQRA